MKSVFLLLNILLVVTISSAQTKNLKPENSTVKITGPTLKNKAKSDSDSGKKEQMKVRKRVEIPSTESNTSATAPSNIRKKIATDPNLNPNTSTTNPSKTANQTAEDNDGNGET